MVFFILLAYVVFVRLDLHKHEGTNYNPSTYHKSSIKQWLQPSSIDNDFPLPISNKIWSIHYTSIEKILRTSNVSNGGTLLINAETLDLLKRVHAKLSSNIHTSNASDVFLNETDLGRLSFLINQSFPKLDGDQFIGLLTRYALYDKAHISLLKSIKQASGEKKIALLKTNRLNKALLQDQHFGSKLAKILFQRKNLTSNYLNDRLLINMSEHLTSTEKKRKLSDLEKIYKTRINDSKTSIPPL